MSPIPVTTLLGSRCCRACSSPLGFQKRTHAHLFPLMLGELAVGPARPHTG